MEEKRKNFWLRCQRSSEFYIESDFLAGKSVIFLVAVAMSRSTGAYVTIQEC